MLKDFTRVAAMPQEVIEKYKDQVPNRAGSNLGGRRSGDLFRRLFEGH